MAYIVLMCRQETILTHSLSLSHRSASLGDQFSSFRICNVACRIQFLWAAPPGPTVTLQWSSSPVYSDGHF